MPGGSLHLHDSWGDGPPAPLVSPQTPRGPSRLSVSWGQTAVVPAGACQMSWGGGRGPSDIPGDVGSGDHELLPQTPRLCWHAGQGRAPCSTGMRTPALTAGRVHRTGRHISLQTQGAHAQSGPCPGCWARLALSWHGCPPRHDLLGPQSLAVFAPIGRMVLEIPKGQPMGITVSWAPP